MFAGNNGFWICVACFAALNGLLHFNDRFRSAFCRTAWGLKFYFLVPILGFCLLDWTVGAAETGSKFAPQVVPFVLGLIQVVLFALLHIGLMMWGMGRPRADWYLPNECSEVDWSDWKGSEDVKTEAKKMVESLRRWPEYEKRGTRPADGALFFGPAGTGKSLLARIIACQSGLPVCIVSSATLNGPFVAMGMLIVKALCRKVRRQASKFGGCIVFLDEIDAIGTTRGAAGSGGMLSPGGSPMGGGNGTLQTLLTEMSGAASGETWFVKTAKRWGFISSKAKKNWRILWIAATNVDLESLDPALIRSGRFGSLKLYIGPPNETVRAELFDHYLRNKHVEGQLDRNQLTQLTRGMTGADIESICDAADRRATFEGREGLTFRDLFDEINLKIYGPPSPFPVDPAHRLPLALHEAGHGLGVARLAPTGQICIGATIRPTEHFLGAVIRAKENDHAILPTEEDCYRAIFISVCSRAAEEVIVGSRLTGVSSDLEQAMSTALNMVEVYGMGTRLRSRLATGGKHSPDTITEAEDIVNATFEVAREYVAANRDAVQALAEQLLAKIDLTGPEVIGIVSAFEEKLNCPSVRDAVQPYLKALRNDNSDRPRHSDCDRTDC